MMTQEYMQGKHKIKIEIADSIIDAKINNFQEGEYTRYYINGKRVDNYMAMMRFIVDETRNNKNNLMPSSENIKKIRKELFQKQQQLFTDQVNALKEQYDSVPDSVISNINSYLDKLDPATNIRNIE
jgi:hypothetical protein